MSPRRPVIYLSVASPEFGLARLLAASVLQAMGCEPAFTVHSGAGPGALRERLRRRVESADAVLQLVGQSYGPETPEPGDTAERCSDTQLEALHATRVGKKIWYLDIQAGPLTDPFASEPDELRSLQAVYRQRLETANLLERRVATVKMLEAQIQEIFSPFSQTSQMPAGASPAAPPVSEWERFFPSPGKRKAFAFRVAIYVLVAVLGVCGIVAWFLLEDGRQRHAAEERAAEMAAERVAQPSANTAARPPAPPQPPQRPFSAGPNYRETESRFINVIVEFPTLQRKLEQEHPGETPAAIDERAFTALAGSYHHLSRAEIAGALRGFARELRMLRASNDGERAQAAYRAGLFYGAEQFALQAARREDSFYPPHHDQAAHWYEFAGRMAMESPWLPGNVFVNFTAAQAHLDRGTNPQRWAQNQSFIDGALQHFRKFGNAIASLRTYVDLRINPSKPNPTELLALRHAVAAELAHDGNLADAEREYRALLVDAGRLLGSDNPETLNARDGLASTLEALGKRAEADGERRAVLAIRKRVQR